MEITDSIVKEHGLSPDEYESIKKLLKRAPNINELGMYSVLWSEHCSYKNSKPVLKNFPTKSKHVLIGPGENSGVIDLGDGVGLSFKIESHNHPSAIEPYQGAATGIGGIIRDIFAMGARPIAGCDSLRFGDIRKDRNSRYLFEHVVKGIGDYGNCVGVPTITGEVYFEDSYTENCLVNAMCIGVVQSGDKKISNLYGPMVKGIAKGEGNLVMYVGAATGRDGIHGATFASVELTEESTEKKSSVQVGDPFQEKLLIEACLEILKTDCVVGLGDMGAAGLTSSLSEMASRGLHGLEIDVALVPQREKGMTPYEILLSESQERMVVIVEKGKEQTAFDIFKKWDLHAVVIGKVTKDGMFRVLENGKVVAEVPARSLADQAPVYHRRSELPKYLKETRDFSLNEIKDIQVEQVPEILKKMLSVPNIASKKWVYEQYDHMVQTNTFLNPGEADAAVVNIKDTNKRIAVKTDGNGRLCYLDPFVGGKIVVAEACRNVACTGATPIAMTNCLNFGNPEKPQSFYQLEMAVKGMSEACNVLGVPVISGNVSLYNESDLGSIYPTPVAGIVGLFQGEHKALDMVFKQAGDLICLVGDTKDELGGSEFLKEIHGLVKGIPPEMDLQKELALQQSLLKAIQNEYLNSAHDISDGGLLVAIAESLLKSGLGAYIDISKPKARLDALLFGESQTRIVCSINKANLEKVKKIFHGLALEVIGEVVLEPALSLKVNKQELPAISVAELQDTYYNAVSKILAKDL